MNFEIYFLMYLMLYRLAIITVGVICVTLGYRMFCKGLWPDSKDENGELRAEIGGMKFFLKNAAPGTFFALFGIVIISAMIITGAPEYTRETLNRPISAKNGKTDAQSSLSSPGKHHEVVKKEILRGELYHASNYPRLMEEANSLERNEYMEKAALKYRDALAVASEAMNNLAWIYSKNHHDKLEEALELSRMAVHFNPSVANFWDTRAKILFQKGKYRDALQAKEEAAELDGKYENGMDEFKEKAAELDNK